VIILELSVSSLAGIVFALALVVLTGFLAGRKVHGSADFTSGSAMNAPMVAGSLVGTLVGGASTIGTAQLAFTYGFSAWWFTLGGAIGLVVLVLCFVPKMRSKNVKTLPQLLAGAYGRPLATLAAVSMSVGTFISILSQLLSAQALITTSVPMNNLAALILTVALMALYVLFGGVRAAGLVGIVKSVLLCGSTLTCGILAITMAGGIDTFWNALPQHLYFDLFARGIWKDGGAGASLLFGVLTTQAYLTPVLSAKNLTASRKGAFLGGILSLLIGLAGIFVGMFMRLHHSDMDSAAALPLFILEYLPDFWGGIALAALLIAIVGTGAGLSLGISTMLGMDIYKAVLRPQCSDKELVRVSRILILAILFCAALLTLGEVGSLILGWSFLSMGLRGAVTFAPMCFALFPNVPISKPFAFLSVLLGPVLVAVGSIVLPTHIDPLFLGMAGSLTVCIVGYLIQKKR